MRAYKRKLTDDEWPPLFSEITEKQKGEQQMTQTNINIDYCGIRNLLLALLDNGFTEAEIKKIAARISVNCGADIIVF